MWTNSDLYGAFEDYVAHDLLEFVDGNYKTVTDRGSRAIMGLSMGGYGSMKIALKHPELFCAVASHSGPLAFDALMEARRPLILDEYASGPPYEYDPDAGPLSGSVFSMSGAWSPNLENPPWLVDFPMDEVGAIRPDVMARWRMNDAPYLASDLDLVWDLGIFFGCGTQDEYIEYPSNLAFADSLDSLGIPYEFQSFEGGHFNLFSERFPIGLTYVVSEMQSVSGLSVESEPNSHADLTLEASGSEPRLRYRLESAADVGLIVHDATGRQIRSLVDTWVPAGEHRVTWDGRDESGVSTASGVYFVRFQVNGELVSGQKVVLLR